MAEMRKDNKKTKGYLRLRKFSAGLTGFGFLCMSIMPDAWAAASADASEETAVYVSAAEPKVINANDNAASDSLFSQIPDDISKEDYERLSDNTIEWDEIENIIKYRNPTYKTYSAQVDEAIGNMKASAEDDIVEMKEQLDDINDSIDSIKKAQEAIMNSGGSTTGEAYKKLSESLELSKALRSSVSSGLSQMGAVGRTLRYGKKNSELSLAPLRYQLISVTEGLIISYKVLTVNREMLSEQAVLYDTLYDTYKSMESQAMATAQNAAAYKEQADAARASLKQLDAGMTGLKGNILIQCGYEADADVTIAELPKADRDFLSGRDIEADRKTAVDGNSSVTAAAGLSGYTGDVLKYRDAGENAAASEVSIKFDNKRAELEKQLILCETSETSLRRAEMLKNSADTKNALGMLGKGEYEGLKLQYIAAEATAKINELNLMQATENYEFALKGIL